MRELKTVVRAWQGGGTTALKLARWNFLNGWEHIKLLNLMTDEVQGNQQLHRNGGTRRISSQIILSHADLLTDLAAGRTLATHWSQQLHQPGSCAINQTRNVTSVKLVEITRGFHPALIRFEDNLTGLDGLAQGQIPQDAMLNLAFNGCVISPIAEKTETIQVSFVEVELPQSDQPTQWTMSVGNR